MKLQLKFKKLHPNAILPEKSGFYAAGWDIFTTETFWLHPGESYLFHTGIAGAIPNGYAMILFDRSGMGAKKNIHRLAGVIDSDYRGEWMVSLINLSKHIHMISTGDKIVQGLLLPVPEAEAVWVDELDETTRGTDGFGSTGN